MSSDNKNNFTLFKYVLPKFFHNKFITYLLRTVLVGFTDFWHFTQLIFHSSWQLAIAINFEHYLLMFVGIKILFSLLFELLYRKLKTIIN